MSLIWLGLGSNMGDRMTILHSTIHHLAQQLKIKRISSVYESAPMYLTDQPWYLNLVVWAQTEQTPLEIFTLCQAVERRHGRVPGVRYGPRRIDIDILAWDQTVIETERLTVPHPRLSERLFVLYPLREIDPEWRHPISGASLDRMIQAVEDRSHRITLFQKSKIKDGYVHLLELRTCTTPVAPRRPDLERGACRWRFRFQRPCRIHRRRRTVSTRSRERSRYRHV